MNAVNRQVTRIVVLVLCVMSLTVLPWPATGLAAPPAGPEAGITAYLVQQGVRGASVWLEGAALIVAFQQPPAETAAAQVRRFREHDEATLRAQAAVKDDESKVIATAQASAQQLEGLFEADQRPN